MLGITSNNVPRYIAKKWIEVHVQSSSAKNRYNPSKQIRFKTLMLRSDLCNFIDAYFIVKGTVTAINPNNNAYDKKLTFKNNAPFVSCISKINNTLIGNAEDLAFVMPMCYCLNTAKIIQKQQEVSGITTKVNQIVM